MRLKTRPAFTIVEVAAGAAMLAVLLTVAGQLLVAMRHTARQSEDRALLLQSVDNALEEFVAAPWAEIEESAAATVRLSDEVTRRWPQARLTAKVTPSTDPVQAKRVTLRLSLGKGSPLKSVTLTTWVYRAERE